MFLVSIVFTQYARYLYPTFPLLAIATTALWCQASSERWRPLLAFYLCVLVALNLLAYRAVNHLYAFFPPTPFAAQPKPQPAYPFERSFNTIVNVTHGRAARVLYLERPLGAGLDGTPLYVTELGNAWLNIEARAVNDLEGLTALRQKGLV